MNSSDKIKELIVDVVSQDPGIKSVELTVKVFKKCNELFLAKRIEDISYSTIPDLLEVLVNDGELVEVEYAAPFMSYRTKSIYFPKETDISIRKV